MALMTRALASCFALALVACPGSLDPMEFGEGGSTMCPDVPMLYATKCGTSGCHAGQFPAASLDLAQPNPATRVIGVKAANCSGLLGDPMNPDQSVMLKKLKGTECGGTRMPLGQPPLSNGDVDCIKQWIVSGGK